MAANINDYKLLGPIGYQLKTRTRSEPGKHFTEATVYSLRDRNGDWALMLTGHPFTFSERRLAILAAKRLYKRHGWLEVTEA